MARQFTASSSMYLSQSTAVVTGDVFTMAAWVWVNDVTTTYSVMTISDPGTSNHYAGIQIAGASGGDHVNFFIKTTASQQTASTSTGASAGAWQHVSGSNNGSSSRKVFLNGGGKGTNSTNVGGATFAPTDTRIGALELTSVIQHIDGRIAYPCVWDVELTDAEHVSLAVGAHPLTIRPQSIVSFWPLTGGGSPEPDIVGVLPLTLNAAPTEIDNPRIFMPYGNRRIVSAAAGGGGGVTIKQGLHRINNGMVRSLHAITDGAV